MQSKIWRNLQTTELQYCPLATSKKKNEINGTVISVHRDKPLWVRYVIETTDKWQTKFVNVEQDYEGRLQELRLDLDNQKRWYLNGEEVLGLRGCEDIDLGVTPATNSLSIRRLKLMQDEQKIISMAWLRFPVLLIEKSSQSYKYLGKRRSDYKSDTFTAILMVDSNEFVE